MKTLDLKNPFAAPVYHEETVSSTFDIARNLAANNEKHGTVITADFQEAGRGRLNRNWVAERGKNLMFTILLRYGNISSIPEALTIKTGLAVSLALEDAAPALAGKVLVKWPNDVMILSCDARCAANAQAAFKVAGILTESDGSNVYIGVGVNVAQSEFPEEYRSKAGSLIQVCPELNEQLRFSLLERILFRLYAETGLGSNESWRERIGKRLYKKCEIVSFAEGRADSGRVIEGTLSGIGSGGELLIIPNGELEEQSFITGELRVY